MRITIDMRVPNKGIKDTHVPIPRPEDVKAKLGGCQYFSKLDLKSTFHQLRISPASMYITVFHADNSLMRYRRLTMGTKPASRELNRALNTIFADIPEARVIHDDIVLAAKTKKDHNAALNKVLQKIKASGLMLNPEKCIFGKEVPFWGMIITHKGVKPDPSKVKSLQTADRPCSKDEVVSFLCMVQSNSDFIPNLAQKTVHLHQLRNI